MRLTTKGQYAVRVMLDVARRNPDPVRLTEMTERQAISVHFLEQLFRKLRTAKLVSSVRGPNGGYILSRPSGQISIKDILDAVGENINPARDILGLPESGFSEHADDEGNPRIVNTTEFQDTKAYFNNLGTMMEEYLSGTTLSDLVRGIKPGAQTKSNEKQEYGECIECGDIGLMSAKCCTYPHKKYQE